MSSSNALKYKIVLKPSYYAGLSLFLLYCLVISLAFLVTPITLYTFIPYLLLVLIAFIAATRAYNHCETLSVSESGLVERKLVGKVFRGKICTASFYNNFFIFLKLRGTEIPNEGKKGYIIIYRDAVSDEHFRMLARLIKNGQE